MTKTQKNNNVPFQNSPFIFLLISITKANANIEHTEHWTNSFLKITIKQVVFGLDKQSFIIFVING